jgi:hypothetical protein
MLIVIPANAGTHFPGAIPGDTLRTMNACPAIRAFSTRFGECGPLRRLVVALLVQKLEARPGARRLASHGSQASRLARA